MQTLSDIIQFGHVVHGWLGVAATKFTPQLAQQLTIPYTRGILVTGTNAGGPADLAGLKQGDVIIAINNQPLDNALSGWKEVAGSRPGETVAIEFIRGGKAQTIEVTLQEKPVS